jgi:hypothetical protein
MNKKAMFFTVLTITILSVFVLGYSIYFINDERVSINKRVDTMNNFVSMVEDDLPRKLHISGFRSIFLFEKRIVESGSYIDDVNERFNELFFNGTLYGADEELMNGITFSEISESYNDAGNKINVNVSFSNPVVNVSQEDSWRIKVSIVMDVLIMDKSSLALWNRSYVGEDYVSIEGFEDPIYLLNSNGLIAHPINQTVYSVFVNGGNVSNLLSHTENGYYKNSTTSPSFLQRLEGDLSANENENGIESLVYLPDFSTQGISTNTKSVVDYIYFSLNNPEFSDVAGMPSWFKLDNAHLDDYGL